MIALYERDARGGGGQQIDLSLFEAVFRFTDVMITAYDKLGIERQRSGNRHFAASPGDHYLSSDGQYVALTVAATNVFKRLCTAIGRPELGDEPRFETHIRRVENYDEINGIVAEWINARPAAEVLFILEANGLPHSLIYTPKDIVADAHYSARGAITTLEHPLIGSLKLPAIQPHFSNGPPPEMRPAPALGADTSDVLTELLGMSAPEIAALRNNGVS